MASVQQHYDNHLGPVYAWMTGDFDTAVAGARAHLRAVGVEESARAILCMGDTLPHLQLLADVAAALVPGGVFVVTLRDYARSRPEGLACIPVRYDERRLLTCVLEYGESTVTVNDLLHELTETGWTLRVSSYEKLRIDPWARSILEGSGLVAAIGVGPGGMVELAAKRPHATPPRRPGEAS